MQRAVAPSPVYYADDAPTPPEPPVRGRLWRALGWVSVVLSVVLVAGSLTAYGFWRRLDGQIDREDVDGRLGDDRPEKLNNSLNILLMGSDSRAGENARYGAEAGQRSDTTILLHISPGGESAIGISFPRDSMVRMPPCKKKNGATVPAQFGMINTAFSNGGPACTWRTIESLTRIHIDHYIEVDFAGFKRVVDALGGVEICVPRRIDDPKAELHLRAGRQVVRGDQALGYVRTRYVLGDGSDLDRIKRQQAFMASVVKKATGKGMLTDPGRTYGFLSAAAKSIKADDGLTLSVMQKLAGSLRGMSAGKVRFVTVPVQAYPQDKNRVQFDQALAEPLFKAVREDNKLPEQTPAPVAGQNGVQPVPPAQVRIGVFNASGTAGLAQRTADQLGERGFQVVKVGTSRKQYPRTQILYGAGAEGQAARTAIAVPGPRPRAWASARPGHVYLVIGREGAKLRGLSPTVPKLAGEIRADRDICAKT
ncbi:LCP family protein [Actinomadura madurae]|uniref:LCP family protein n=1 Tax=Actinomadura madurae TaxID=1993 RepID=UPI002026C2F5|nr:LCP family protein [Actinomadura madurae]MCP9967576.1 LCP family protein [Actinomadura madurae]MCQ0008445.1 LCP family protein [Actinomadura madurae]MCQ0016240.1 LCP family protein [Actinomadura madurae]URN07032.1 LCP family protein [Actinomadura madurae]